jgi:hypothetical protein
LASGIFHYASGWVIFIVAMIILVLFHQLLNLVHRRLYDRK